MKRRFHRFALHVLFAALGIAISGSSAEADEAESEWSVVNVPGTWEAAPRFADYDGVAWYRCYVTVPDNWVGEKGVSVFTESVSITIDHVSDAYEVYVNGRKIGGAGVFPPNYQRGAEESHRHKIPPGVLVASRFNVVAIRIYNRDGGGGFKGGPPIFAGYHRETALRGGWEFRTGDDKRWAISAAESAPPHARFDEFVPAT